MPEAVGLAEAGGQVGPGYTGFGEEADGVNEQPRVVADTTMMAGLTRQQVLDAIPMIITDIMTAEHGWLLLSPPAIASCLASVNTA